MGVTGLLTKAGRIGIKKGLRIGLRTTKNFAKKQTTRAIRQLSKNILSKATKKTIFSLGKKALAAAALSGAGYATEEILNATMGTSEPITIATEEGGAYQNTNNAYTEQEENDQV